MPETEVDNSIGNPNSTSNATFKATAPSPGRTRRLATSTKDHLVDYVMTAIAKKLSSSSNNQKSQHSHPSQNYKKGESLPTISLSVFASSLIRINHRTKLLSYVQPHIVKFLSWEHPAYTISILCIYTIICFRPYLIASLTLLGILAGVMVPGYDHRHPFPEYLLPQKGPRVSEYNVIDSPEDILSMRREQQLLLAKTSNKKVNAENVTTSGNSNSSFTADSRNGVSTETSAISNITPKSDESTNNSSIDNNLTTLSITTINGTSANHDELTINPDEKETSDILKSIRQLQTLLNDIANLLDTIEEFFYGIGSFSGDERKSTALYLLLLVGVFILPIGASFIPINLACAAIGWAGVGILHPMVGKEANRIKEEYLEVEEEALEDLFNEFEKRDIIIEDNGPEDSRDVEIFELQRQGLTPRLWDPWVFTPLVYSDRSVYRISEDRPPGCGFLESVLPPPGWYFNDVHPWVLDENTKSWVLDRCVLNVEIDLDEHWAYDYKDGQRGEWRRRRWTRPCFRGAMPARKK